MSDQTTTANTPNFPTRDITHKPRRMQSDNLSQADPESVGEATVDTGDVPQNVTLERAIRFYEEHVTDPQMGRLYRQTAVWLKDYLNKSHKKTKED